MDTHTRNNLFFHVSEYLLLYCRSCADCNAVCFRTQSNGSKSTSLRSIPRAVPPKPEPGWGRPWQSSFPVPATKSACQSVCSTDASIKVPSEWVLIFPCLKWIRAIRLSLFSASFLTSLFHTFVPPFFLGRTQN